MALWVLIIITLLFNENFYVGTIDDKPAVVNVQKKMNENENEWDELDQRIKRLFTVMEKQ